MEGILQPTVGLPSESYNLFGIPIFDKERRERKLVYMKVDKMVTPLQKRSSCLSASLLKTAKAGYNAASPFGERTVFKKNTRYLPLPLTGHGDELPETLRTRLHNSWAETCYRDASVGRTKSCSACCTPMCPRGRMCRSTLNVQTFKRSNLRPPTGNADVSAPYLTGHAGQDGDRLKYVANLAETCAPENPFQLITQVQVAPNRIDDAHLLAEAVPALKRCTGLDTPCEDGTCGSAQEDIVLQEHGLTPAQTGIRGRRPDPQRLSLRHFEITQENGDGLPRQMSCPARQPLAVTWGSWYLQAHLGGGQATKWPKASGNRRGQVGKGSVFSFVSAPVQALRALGLHHRRLGLSVGKVQVIAVESTFPCSKRPSCASPC